MIKEFFKKKNFNLLNNTILIFILFLICLSAVTIIYSNLIVKKYPALINNLGEYQINRIGFNFNQIIENLMKGETPKANYIGIDFYVSRMPFLPYFLFFFTEFITKNFILIHLIKNLIFGIIIFLNIKFFENKTNNLFLIICLISIYYIPHNLVTMLSTNFEEGFLIYLLIILFFIINSNFKLKSIFTGLTLSAIFFLKSSMFYFCFGISFLFLFINKKKRYLPLFFVMISSIIWGTYSLEKTNKFAFGSSSSSFNGTSSLLVFHQNFNYYYPKYSPDRFQSNMWEEISKKKFKSEWEVNNYAFSKSIEYIKDNPKEVIIGVFKKLYIIFISPYKDTIHEDEIENKIRYSNFPNKIIFIISIFSSIRSLISYNKLVKFKLFLNLYYISFLIFYFFPYVSAFVYPRHSVSMYVIAHLYLILNFKELIIKKFNNQIDIKT